MKEFLPLGSVVLLKEGKKKLMICGRYQKEKGKDVIFDYSGCLYPEGYIGAKRMILFDNHDIDRVYYVGMQDPEEFKFRNELSKKYEQNEGNGEENVY